MHSISKQTIEQATAQAICNATFGSAAAIRAFGELTDGFFNAAYRIELADGLRCVLKVAPPDDVPVLRYETNMMHAEVAALRLARERTALPVPAIYRFDASRQLVGSPYVLMEFVPGVPLDKLRPQLAPAEQQAIDGAVGAYLRELNAVAGPTFGYIAPGARQHDSWRAAFLGILDDVLADGQALGVALPRPYDTLRHQAGQLAAALDEVVEPRLVHWDLWDGNIFVDPATQRISGLIDFERALWGDPLMECQFRTFAVPASFAAGYRQPMLDTPAARARRVLYNLHLYLIVVIESYYRQYDTPALEQWGRQELDAELARLDGIAEGA